MTSRADDVGDQTIHWVEVLTDSLSVNDARTMARRGVKRPWEGTA